MEAYTKNPCNGISEIGGLYKRGVGGHNNGISLHQVTRVLNWRLIQKGPSNRIPGLEAYTTPKKWRLIQGGGGGRYLPPPVFNRYARVTRIWKLPVIQTIHFQGIPIESGQCHHQDLETTCYSNPEIVPVNHGGGGGGTVPPAAAPVAPSGAGDSAVGGPSAAGAGRGQGMPAPRGRAVRARDGDGGCRQQCTRGPSQ